MNEFVGILKTIWKYASFPLVEVSGNKLSLMSLLTAVVVFYGAILLSRGAERMVRKVLSDKPLDRGVKDSIQRFTRYSVLIIGALVTLDTIGISISSLAAVGAVLMVGIGFGLQNITQNFISGLIILLERPIKVGDLVKVEGVSGKVIEIGARSTLIHTRDDVAIIVPNSQFISEQVVNESFSGENIRLHIKVGVSYSSDPELVKETLLLVAKEQPEVLDRPESQVFFKDFGDSSLDFELTVWVKDNWRGDLILSDLRFRISKAFGEKNIEIPFPQRDVHLKNS